MNKQKKTIVELSKKYNTDKKMNDGNLAINNCLGHDYAELYDKFLVNKKINKLLEIGVSFGSSIKMWDEYFNGLCEIYGIDINEKRFKKENLINENVKILIGNQNSTSFLEKNFKNKIFDLIIDDGSHRMKDQQISFKYLFHKLNKNGIYVIEDLHTSKDSNFFDKNPETTTLELLKNLKSGNIIYNNYISRNELLEIKNNIKNIYIYENMINNSNKKYIIAFLIKK